jgi:hypothetical protein
VLRVVIIFGLNLMMMGWCDDLMIDCQVMIDWRWNAILGLAKRLG